MKFVKGYIPWNKGIVKEFHKKYGKKNNNEVQIQEFLQ